MKMENGVTLYLVFRLILDLLLDDRPAGVRLQAF